MKKDLLSKMKMPSQASDPMLELGEDELALESEDEAQDEMAMEEEATDPAIAQAEDEDLAKELEKRGWALTPPAEEEESDESLDSPEVEEDPLA